MDLEVLIKCQGASEISLDEVQLLHHFKTLTDDDYARGRNLFIDRGFKFPFSLWIDEQGGKWTVDGHQRIAILKRMRDEGVRLPDLFPCDLVFASSKEDAAKDIIASETKLAEINESDFTQFLSDYSIPWEDVEDWVNIPLEDEKRPYTSPDKQPKTATCPNCQTKFEI